MFTIITEEAELTASQNELANLKADKLEKSSMSEGAKLDKANADVKGKTQSDALKVQVKAMKDAIVTQLAKVKTLADAKKAAEEATKVLKA